MFLALQLLAFLSFFCWAVAAFIANGAAVSGAIVVPKRVVSASPLEKPPSDCPRGERTQLGAIVNTNLPLTNLEMLRRCYGRRQNIFSGLSARETRQFYHELLPVSLQLTADSSVPEEVAALSLEERARLASMARAAAKQYMRERSSLPARVTATLYDGFRHLQKYGTWSWTGHTWEELWMKYEKQVRTARPDLNEDAVREEVCKLILEKSCCTNAMFDALTGCLNEHSSQPREAPRLNVSGEKASAKQPLEAAQKVLKRTLLQARRRITRPPLLGAQRALRRA